MQLVKGSHNPDGVTTNRVLVIDDPVSSLDEHNIHIIIDIPLLPIYHFHKSLTF